MEKFLKYIINFCKLQKDRFFDKNVFLPKKGACRISKNLTCVNFAATLSIQNQANKKTRAFRENIEKIVSKYYKEPKKLFEYIEKSGTRVYINKNADKILKTIDEKGCLILPQNGFKALYLNLVLNKKISFKIDEIFIAKSYNVSLYTLIYGFYKWYCYKNKLEGYEIKTQKKFKHVFEICETSKINNLSLDELIELETAVKRDMEAIQFVQEFTKRKITSKECLNKILEGKAITV